MISAIVSVDEKMGIGANGKLLASYPEDMKFFKAMTTGHVVVMGRKTWDSLPIKPLPNRTNIVITSKPQQSNDINVEFITMEEFLDNLDYLDTGDREIFIIGGASIYKQLLPYCQKIYMTLIPAVHEEADTFFPLPDIHNEWEIVGEEFTTLDKCAFITLKRR